MSGKIYVVTGQTATGKTNYAIALALKNNGELISADSRQIYKYLDVVTGKDLGLTDGIFHRKSKIDGFEIGYYNSGKTKIWLYDMVDPAHDFSAFDFKTCAQIVIKDMFSRGKTPILVGGSYFYLKTWLYNTINFPVPPNPDLRKELNNKTVSQLQFELNRINPAILPTMNNSDKNNPHRLIRKIEIAKFTKANPKSNNHINSEYNFEMTGFAHRSKETILRAISDRVEERIRLGAFEETKKILSGNFKVSDPGFQTIGYKQIIQYLENQIDRQHAIDNWITAEIQYAKRQLTFMKKDKNIRWIFI